LWRDLTKHHRQTKTLGVNRGRKFCFTTADDDVAVPISLLLKLGQFSSRPWRHANQASEWVRLTKQVDAFVFKVFP